MIVSLTGCASIKMKSRSKTLEHMVSCNTESVEIRSEADVLSFNIDQEWDFTRTPNNPNFYTPNLPMEAFNHKIKYIGLNGVDMRVGPNVTVEGKQEEVVSAISKIKNIAFKCTETGCHYKKYDNKYILIYPHRTNDQLTTIQCYMRDLSY